MKYVLWTLLGIVVLFGIGLWALYAPYNLPQCTNANPIFDTCRPGDREYDAELVKQLNRIGYGKAFFRIKDYFRENERDYLTVYIQGPGLCTEGIMDITGKDQMSHVIELKAFAYHGLVMADMRYTIDSTDGRYRFIFEHLSWIVD